MLLNKRKDKKNESEEGQKKGNTRVKKIVLCDS